MEKTTTIIRARGRQFNLPPFKDGLVVGRDAPIGKRALERAIQLLTPEQFLGIETEDEVIGCVFIRKSDLRKIERKKIINFILRYIKPIMNKRDTISLDLEITIEVEDEI